MHFPLFDKYISFVMIAFEVYLADKMYLCYGDK